MMRRFYRLKDAPSYLGMDARRFNADVRPYLSEIPLGPLGVAFDGLEMDQWADYYVRYYAKPAKRDFEDMKPSVSGQSLRDEIFGRKGETKEPKRLLSEVHLCGSEFDRGRENDK